MTVLDVSEETHCIIAEKIALLLQSFFIFYSSPQVQRLRLCFSFKMGIHTSPTATNITPTDRQAEATERVSSVTPDDWSRRSAPAADIRNPITITMMGLWKTDQLGLAAAADCGLTYRLSLPEGEVSPAASMVGTLCCFHLRTFNA